MPLPVGLVYDAAGHVILDPDTAIQGALAHLFTTFEATGSATAVREGVQRRRPDLPLAAPERAPQGRGRLAAAAAPRRAAGAAQPPLRRRVHLRPAPRAAAARRESQHHGSCPARNGPPSSPAPTPDTSPWTSTRPTSPGWPPTPPRTAATAPPGRPAKAPPCCRASSSAAAAAARMTVRYHARGGQELPTYVCQRDGIDNGRPICTAIPGHTLDQQHRRSC